jgi:hypothetical protein
LRYSHNKHRTICPIPKKHVVPIYPPEISRGVRFPEPNIPADAQQRECHHLHRCCRNAQARGVQIVPYGQERLYDCTCKDSTRFELSTCIVKHRLRKQLFDGHSNTAKPWPAGTFDRSTLFWVFIPRFSNPTEHASRVDLSRTEKSIGSKKKKGK